MISSLRLKEQVSNLIFIRKFNNEYIQMKLIVVLIILCFNLKGELFSQVKIGDNPSVINSSSLFELESIDKGFLLPRMTTVQRDAISNPVTGLEIYNTSTNHINYYDGSEWTSMDKVLRNNHVLVQDVTDFPASSGGVITLQTNTTYEINGSIMIADKINLNNATIIGLDGFEDQVIYSQGQREALLEMF